MLCRCCGSELAEDIIYCTRCGEKIDKEPVQDSQKNRFIKAFTDRPVESALYIICIALLVCTLNGWITISPSLLTLSSLSDVMPYISNLGEMGDVLRTDFSALDIVNLFFTMFKSMQGNIFLPLAAILMIVGYFAILVLVAVFGILLYSNSKSKRLFAKLTFTISIVVAAIPFLVSFLLNNMISTMLLSANIPSAFLDVRIFTVSVFPYLIIGLSVAGLILQKKLSSKKDEELNILEGSDEN